MQWGVAGQLLAPSWTFAGDRFSWFPLATCLLMWLLYALLFNLFESFRVDVHCVRLFPKVNLAATARRGDTGGYGDMRVVLLKQRGDDVFRVVSTAGWVPHGTLCFSRKHVLIQLLPWCG